MANFPDASRPLSRRTLLGASGAATAAAFLSPLGATRAQAAPAAGGFDLSLPSYDLFRGVALASETVPQGIAFDEPNGRLFAIQLTSGTGETSGDLTVTQLDLTGGQHGQMKLTGFGHGVSIAAETVGTSTYLWTETDANANGYGSRLCRFKFTNGSTLANTSSLVTKYTPVPTGTEFTCSVDHTNQRMAVRYQTSAGKRVAVFPLAEALVGNFGTVLYDFAQPADFTGVTFQGYCLYGDYLYTLDGTAYGTTNPSPGNAYVSALDLSTGQVVQRFLTKAGGTLDYREPEGMSVSTIQGEPRLYFGFGSGVVGARKLNVFYKH